MSWLHELMSDRCEHCPMCRYARDNPKTWFGRLMEWHGRWCPFWKSWKERHGGS